MWTVGEAGGKEIKESGRPPQGKGLEDTEGKRVAKEERRKKREKRYE